MQRIEAGIGLVALAVMRRALRLRMRGRIHRFVDDKGRATPWIELGTARKGTVVWLHGFNDRPDSFLRSALELWRDYRVVAPAVPGFFRGWIDPEERHTVASFGRWVAPVLAKAVPEPHLLVGNSLGGAIALELAATHDITSRGVMVVNPAGMRVDGAPSVLDDMANDDNPFEITDREGVHRLFTRLLGRTVRVPFPFEAALYEEMRGQADWYGRLGKELAASEQATQGDDWESAIALSSVEVPVRVFWGERDTLFPLVHGERMAAALPNASLERHPRVGHIAHVEAPGLLAASIRRFAEEIAA